MSIMFWRSLQSANLFKKRNGTVDSASASQSVIHFSFGKVRPEGPNMLWLKPSQKKNLPGTALSISGQHDLSIQLLHFFFLTLEWFPSNEKYELLAEKHEKLVYLVWSNWHMPQNTRLNLLHHEKQDLGKVGSAVDMERVWGWLRLMIRMLNS